ncbi:universal stress protein [Bradyrhizobium sp.]|uniref:universal stress protein n=1 Tax=Bradyrhizobium sp. TaxID=376 RepID=UPI0023A0CF63|nr:universal stress protein [Bradyrhizobium sp.]MDE1934143.1 universal stress protein [Bradyrhizobium sp.]
MYKNILIATDGSDLAARAVKSGVSLAKTIDAKVTAVTVSEPFHWFEPNMVEGAETAYTEGAKRTAAATLESVLNTARAASVPCETVHAVDQFPYKGIIDVAKAKGCDLIVMASHGRQGMAAVVLGSQTAKVLTHSAIPVLVCH